MKVKILVPFRFEVDRKAVEFEPGIAEMPDSAVEAFINAGYAALIEDEPAIKIVAKNEGKRKAQVK
jgi:hypothetical protein